MSRAISAFVPSVVLGLLLAAPVQAGDAARADIVRIAAAAPEVFERDHRGRAFEGFGRLIDVGRVPGTDRIAHVTEIGDVLVVCAGPLRPGHLQAPPVVEPVAISGTLHMLVEGVVYLGEDCAVASTTRP